VRKEDSAEFALPDKKDGAGRVPDQRDAAGPASRQELMAALAAELRAAVRGAERRSGRAVDKAVLARQVSVSRNSVYAYLDGSRLPPAAILDALLLELGVDSAERHRLGEERDAIAEHRRRGERAAGAEQATSAAEAQRATSPADAEPADSPADAQRAGSPADTADPAADPATVGLEPIAPQPSGTEAPPPADPVPAAPPPAGTETLAPEPGQAGDLSAPPAVTEDAVLNQTPRRPGRWRGRRLVLAGVLAAVVLAVGVASAWYLHSSARPSVVVTKGASAVGHIGRSGNPCTDPSCAFVTIVVQHFRPHQSYVLRCHATGGRDPVENRAGYFTTRITTDAHGDAELSGAASCLWGYQATQVWASIEAPDGSVKVVAPPVDW
jgi:hypothetical protein